MMVLKIVKVRIPIMTLDIKRALALVLTTHCTISSKLVDAQSYCFIFTLMESLSFFQKYQIIVNLFGALTVLNFTNMD